MIKKLAAALVFLFSANDAFAVNPSFVQWQFTNTGGNPQTIQLRDRGGTWITFGQVNSAAHTFTVSGVTFNCSVMPALIGDVTNSAGSCATTFAAVAASTIIGNNTGSSNSPIALTATQVQTILEGSYCQPFIQVYQTAGGSSGTFTTPTCNGILPSVIEVEFSGAGGAGGGSGTSGTAGNGVAGGTSSFGTALYSATGGAGGTKGLSTSSPGGVGGVGIGCLENLSGATGGSGGGPSYTGIAGGDSVKWGLGGAASAQLGMAGNSGLYGGGGAGGTTVSGSFYGGGGGGGGGYCHAWVTTGVASTYAYVQGTGGTGGTAGTSGFAGGAGGDGHMIITARWQ